MTFEDQKFDLTDKELDFAKSNPKVFEKYLDYCKDQLEIKKMMLNVQSKEMDHRLKQDEINRIQTIQSQKFWEDLAYAGVTSLFDWLSNKQNQGDQK